MVQCKMKDAVTPALIEKVHLCSSPGECEHGDNQTTCVDINECASNQGEFTGFFPLLLTYINVATRLAIC